MLTQVTREQTLKIPPILIKEGLSHIVMGKPSVPPRKLDGLYFEKSSNLNRTNKLESFFLLPSLQQLKLAERKNAKV